MSGSDKPNSNSSTKKPDLDSNPWALDVIELVANNLRVSSPELNSVYRRCLSLLKSEAVKQRRQSLRLVRGPDN